jgi:hypothetical protein
VASTSASTPTTPRHWEALTSALLVLGSVAAALYLIAAVVVVTSGKPWSEAERVALLTLVFAQTLLENGWLIWTRRLVRSFGDDGSGLTRHGAFRLAFPLIVVAFVVYALDRNVLVFSVLWVASLAASLLGVVKMRAVVRGLISGKNMPYAEDPELRAPILPGPTMRFDAPPETAGLAPADDDFWSAVSAARASGGAALLETTPTQTRRWLDLPADGDLTAVRASVPAGATLTLWPAPLAVAGKPPAALEYYGLLQATAGGPIRFQLVLPSRVAAFTAGAHTVHRAGLYLPTDLTARTALHPE